MVVYWDVQLKTAIALTKMRIKHHEKHGCGETCMRDKKILEKQIRLQKLRDDI